MKTICNNCNRNKNGFCKVSHKAIVKRNKCKKFRESKNDGSKYKYI